jgi:hypothetical protein
MGCQGLLDIPPAVRIHTPYGISNNEQKDDIREKARRKGAEVESKKTELKGKKREGKVTIQSNLYIV